MKLQYLNRIPVAAHRGNAKYFPENTMGSFRSAAALSPDMIETDLHMSADGEIIIMHDHTVDRTTEGHGLIREKTLAEIKKLDAGFWKSEEFRGERVPTFSEFLDFFRAYPSMLFNIELKDYPADSGAFAYASAEKALSMMDAAGILERSVINTWSGELNEYLAERWGDRIKIHAYSPQEKMGLRQKRFVYTYAYCVCLFGTKDCPVVDKSRFDFCKSYGVEPWVYYPVDTEELYSAAIERGAMLFTSNDPAWAMNYLRSKGLHK
jgi:glycerophosphoryl diester phosphodiesterase